MKHTNYDNSCKKVKFKERTSNTCFLKRYELRTYAVSLFRNCFKKKQILVFLYEFVHI